jgi:hypothetical protein
MKYVVVNKLNEVISGVIEASIIPVFEEENTLRPVEVVSYPDSITVKGQIYLEVSKSVEDTDRSLANKKLIQALRDSDYRVIRALEHMFLRDTVIGKDRQAIRDKIE